MVEIKDNSFRMKTAVIKMRYGRGQGWISLVRDIAGMFTAALLLDYLLRQRGIIIPYLAESAIFLPFIYMFLCYIAGWLDEKYGIWLHESIYSMLHLNPVSKAMYDEICEKK